MKKIFSLIIGLIVFSSCQEEIVVYNPGFQAYKDDVLFRGVSIKAYKSTAGALRIVAIAQEEEMELRTYSANIGTYYLGSINNNYAIYSTNFDNTSVAYSTLSGGVPNLNIANVVITGGSNYSAGNYVATTAEHGTGMKVNTTISETGAINSVKIVASGSGYKPGRVITISGGNGKAQFKILGEIVITDNSDNTVTGNFKFNVKKSGSEDLVNFQHGAFYKIPVIPEL